MHRCIYQQRAADTIFTLKAFGTPQTNFGPACPDSKSTPYYRRPANVPQSLAVGLLTGLALGQGTTGPTPAILQSLPFSKLYVQTLCQSTFFDIPALTVGMWQLATDS